MKPNDYMNSGPQLPSRRESESWQSQQEAIARLEADNAALRAELELAYALLDDLRQHWVSYEDSGSECVHCGADVHVARPTQHHNGCAYVAAMDALEARAKKEQEG